MSACPEKAVVPFSQFEQVREARQILRHEARALESVADRIDTSFAAAVELLARCSGCAIVTGMGKAGLVGQKIAATLSSTGTRAHFLHPAEAVHGDLGAIHPQDVVLLLSNSGETEEICRLLPILLRWGNPLIAITSCETSTLAERADVTLTLGRLCEAGEHGLAPTTSTTAMLALGDALALIVSRVRGFTPRDFAVYHPAGSLGQQLRSVHEVMRQGEQLRVSAETATVREVFVQLGKPGRRTGAVMLVDGDGRLTGLFTDSDLARLLETRHDFQLDRAIAEVMTCNPLTVSYAALLRDAVQLLGQYRISELPVVDGEHRPVGLIDITDVIGVLPAEQAE